MKRKHALIAFFQILLVTIVGLVTLAPTQFAQAQVTSISPNVFYRLVARHSGKVLDVTGQSTADGGNVQQWSSNGQVNQQWRFVDMGGGFFKVINRNSGKLLDVANSSTADGANVRQWADLGTTNQQWRAVQVSTGIYKFVARHSGKALDVAGQSTADGANVQQWSDNGQTNQQWQLVQVDGTSPTPVPPTPTPGCTATPVDPNATAQARKLLCYLYSIYGNHILSGQREFNGSENEFNYIRTTTGKDPAIRGMDMCDRPNSIDRALAWWNAGGIPLIGWHVGAPATSPCNYGGTASINATLTSGTAENRSYIADLDAGASQLLRLQSQNVAILWAPYHEAGGTWFWWSKENGAQYQRLWRFQFDYFTKTKGIHNLVWLHPYDGSPSASFYPGKAFVDIGGADTYVTDHGPLNGLFNTTRNIVGSTIPIALHENGAIPDPDQLQSTNTRWVLFNTWNGDWLTGKNDATFLRKVYGHSYVITRDELPNLK